MSILAPTSMVVIAKMRHRRRPVHLRLTRRLLTDELALPRLLGLRVGDPRAHHRSNRVAHL